jgi:hypothetical protein
MLPAKQEKGIMQLILEGNSNRQLVRTMGSLTMQQAMNTGVPGIATLVRRHGREKVEKVLAVMVSETAAYFDADMGQEQALDIAAEISIQYAAIKLEDVWVCLNELKSTEIYGKLTSNKVLSALKKYMHRRLEVAEQQSLNQHLAHQAPRRSEGDGKEGDFKAFKHQWELDKMKNKHEAK